MQKSAQDNSMENYINMAKTGHYPLFFQEWLDSPLKEAKPVSLTRANKTVKDLFKRMEKHKSMERKKTLLISLQEKERNEFIRSFLKMVERDILKDIKSLH